MSPFFEYSKDKTFIGISGLEISEEISILPGLIIRPVSLKVNRPIVLVKDGKQIAPPHNVSITPSDFEI
ncbi:MAG: hypothetical protein ABI778_03865, partial [Ignavibacteriota bacterium]